MLSSAAFAAFYAETATALRKYVARCVGGSGSAEDIVQEAYLRLLRHPPATEVAGELRAYLFGIASNLMTDGWRRRKTETATFEPAAASDPDTAAELDMQRTFLKLRPLDRQLLWLAYVEGASHREIAAALGLGEASIRVLLSRARACLLSLLHPAPQPERSRFSISTQLLKLRTRGAHEP